MENLAISLLTTWRSARRSGCAQTMPPMAAPHPSNATSASCQLDFHGPAPEAMSVPAMATHSATADGRSVPSGSRCPRGIPFVRLNPTARTALPRTSARLQPATTPTPPPATPSATPSTRFSPPMARWLMVFQRRLPVPRFAK